MPCPTCGGEGWMCEEHPDKPLAHDGCSGAGDPCPDCQSADAPLNPPGFVSIVPVEPRRLVAGDEMKCWRCVGWHVLETGRLGGHPHADKMLYITCGGKQYYAGSAGLPAERPTRQRRE